MHIVITRINGALMVRPGPPYLQEYLQYHHRMLGVRGYQRVNEFEKRLLHAPDGAGGLTTFAGFFEQICKLIGKNGDTLEVVDNRTPLPDPDWQAVKDINWDAIGSTGLRDYQIDPVVDFILKLKENSGVVNATGGYGKTILQAATYAAFNNLNTILAIPLKQVFKQTYEKFVKLFPHKHIGCVGDGSRDISEDITITTFRSLPSCATEKCQLLLVDEIQSSTGDGISATIMGMNPIRCVGYTATDKGMFSGTEKLLKGMYGERLIHIEYSEAQKAGAVVPGHVFFVKVPSDRPVSASTIVGKINSGIKNHEGRNKLVAEVCRHVPNRWQTIVFVDHVMDHLVKLHKEMPPGTRFLHRDADKKRLGEYALTPKEQDRIVDSFQNNEFQFLLATDAFRAGVDIPNCRVVVQASGGSSEIEILQEAYRGSRILPEGRRAELGVEPKTHMVIVDFLDDHDDALENMARKRMAFYKKEGWSVTVVDSPDQIKWNHVQT